MAQRRSRPRLRERCAFFRRNNILDDLGNVSSGFETIAFLEVWGSFRPQSSRERLFAGRLEASTLGTLIIRWSRAAAEITAADKVRIDGIDYAIRSDPFDMDRNKRWLQMTIEGGVGL